jgi:branched-chain amino acid transport system permease protein
MLYRGWPFWTALLVGGGSAFITGLILGLLALRLRGDYLGMVTLGFGEIIRIIAINWVAVTRGPMGLPGIPRPSIFGYTFQGEIPFYYLGIVLVVFTHLTIERMLFSRFGRGCLAIRDDEVAAQAMGVEGYQYKVLAFCISSGYAGLAGVFYASWSRLFSPDSFQLVDSIMMAIMITLGGIGSLLGAIPGAIVIGALPESSTSIYDRRQYCQPTLGWGGFDYGCPFDSSTSRYWRDVYQASLHLVRANSQIVRWQSYS